MERIAQGREAEIYAWADGLVVRVMKDPADSRSLPREQAAMRAAAAAGILVPLPGDLVTVDGREGLVMERLEGIDLLTRIEKQPWTVLSAGRITAETHAQLVDVTAPAELPDLHDGIQAQLMDPKVPASAAKRAHELLAKLPRGSRICHGDFHPGNFILTAGGAKVIDWAHASAGPPVADFAKTLVVLRAGALPEETPRYIRVGARRVRGLLVRIYSRTFRAAADADLVRLNDWLFVQAVARFAVAIPGEAPVLRRLAREAARGR